MDTAQNKIQEICDLLKKETLDPAKQEAGEIVENAHMKADEIVQNAKAEAKRILKEAEKKQQEKQKVFEASLNLSCKQGIDTLREKIEKQLFNEQLRTLIQKPLKDLNVISQLVNTIVQAIENEGIDVDLSAYVPKEVPAKKVNELLASSVIERLREKGVVLQDVAAGVQVKIHDENITIDISDEALKDLVSQYIRKDFREMVFNV